MNSLYAGASGMKTHSSGLQTISSNIANVNTIGFKQQSMLFEDMMYQGLSLGSSGAQVTSQKGMGASISAVRTLFTQGAFEPSNEVTDLALGGKGFFQVSNGENTHYTRAGNFRFNLDGELRDPNGYTLSGIRIQNGVPQGGISPIRVNVNDPEFSTNPPKATTSLSGMFNLGFTEDASKNEANPYFSLLSSWNGTSKPPLDKSDYGYSQPMRFYDAEGKTHNATIYFDGAPGTSGQNVYEYVLAMDPADDGGTAAGTAGAGLLMSGTLSFSKNGELVDMSAFTPSGGDYTDLANWVPSPMVDGKPQATVRLGNGLTQTLTLNLGIAGKGGWANPPASAAAVGTDAALLSSLGGYTRESEVTTAYGKSSNTKQFNQNGYGVGAISGLNINNDGLVQATYSNGQALDLYSIPVFRFTSEDGLRQEGMNHFSATDESGAMEYGTAGTENYGKINANTLETSNVDMSREMVNLIIMQRGFQMNSKTVTTADTMLQKALELKR